MEVQYISMGDTYGCMEGRPPVRIVGLVSIVSGFVPISKASGLELVGPRSSRIILGFALNWIGPL